MPRKLLIKTNEFPYHISSRTNNKEWFPLPLDEVWNILRYVIKKAYEKFPFELHSLVLMNNHYHLIITTPNCDVNLIMYEINKHFSKIIAAKSNRINKILGGRYGWTIIAHENHYKNVYRYVYQNPLRAGIVLKCEDYKYSTLRYKINSYRFCVPVEPLLDIEDGLNLSWINSSYENEQVQVIKKSLKKKYFQVGKNKNGKIISLDH